MTLSHVVEGVSPDEAARWWSDFQEGRHDHPMLPGHERRIVARSDTSVSMIDETRLLGLPLFRERTTAWPEPRRVRFVGVNGFGRFEGSYSFEPAGGATRIVLDARIDLARPWAWGTFAARPVATAILRADLAHHAKELRKDMNAGRQKAGDRRA